MEGRTRVSYKHSIPPRQLEFMWRNKQFPVLLITTGGDFFFCSPIFTFFSLSPTTCSVQCSTSKVSQSQTKLCFRFDCALSGRNRRGRPCLYGVSPRPRAWMELIAPALISSFSRSVGCKCNHQALHFRIRRMEVTFLLRLSVSAAPC